MKINELSPETRDFLVYGKDLPDFASEFADGDQDVIYHHRAHALIAECGRSERIRAEEEARECGMGETDYDTLATRIAYFIVRNRVTDLISTELEHYEEEGEDLTEDSRDVIKSALDDW
jgi:hypothetical protein